MEIIVVDEAKVLCARSPSGVNAIKTVLVASALSTRLAALVAVFVIRIALREDIQTVMLPSGILPVKIELAGTPVIHQTIKLSLINRTGEPRTATLHLPAELGATITMPSNEIVLPPNHRVEVLASIDVPLTCYVGDRIETTLTVREASGVEHVVEISLRKP